MTEKGTITLQPHGAVTSTMSLLKTIYQLKIIVKKLRHRESQLTDNKL